jgi:hypothetical protein
MCSNYINAIEDNHMNMFAKFIKLWFEVKQKSKPRERQSNTQLTFGLLLSVGWGTCFGKFYLTETRQVLHKGEGLIT